MIGHYGAFENLRHPRREDPEEVPEPVVAEPVEASKDSRREDPEEVPEPVEGLSKGRSPVAEALEATIVFSKLISQPRVPSRASGTLEARWLRRTLRLSKGGP